MKIFVVAAVCLAIVLLATDVCLRMASLPARPQVAGVYHADLRQELASHVDEFCLRGRMYLYNDLDGSLTQVWESGMVGAVPKECGKKDEPLMKQAAPVLRRLRNFVISLF